MKPIVYFRFVALALVALLPSLAKGEQVSWSFTPQIPSVNKIIRTPYPSTLPEVTYKVSGLSGGHPSTPILSFEEFRIRNGESGTKEEYYSGKWSQASPSTFWEFATFFYVADVLFSPQSEDIARHFSEQTKVSGELLLTHPLTSDHERWRVSLRVEDLFDSVNPVTTIDEQLEGNGKLGPHPCLLFPYTDFSPLPTIGQPQFGILFLEPREGEPFENVPEPSSLILGLIGTGIVGMRHLRRRRRCTS